MNFGDISGEGQVGDGGNMGHQLVAAVGAGGDDRLGLKLIHELSHAARRTLPARRC
jgi:hypothetical protein